ncbi:hypothetical protein AVEN_37111-1 [Araneus ventricosus]|uniref:Uncharacterized protein n=1 Tax=Araneus ventricosus TaxID=182803 RepID=A0A4Y2TH26_ARAVE|nr:hypothetical protein AVEN_37111-1 [Araneus ventricosus]
MILFLLQLRQVQAYRLPVRPRFKGDTGKKSKMVASKSSPSLQSRSESTEQILQDKNSRIPLIEKDPELKETKYPTPEKMETTAENTEPESRPSIQSSDQAYVSEAEGNLK